MNQFFQIQSSENESGFPDQNGGPRTLHFVEADELRARVAARIREIAKRRKVHLTVLADRAGLSRGHLFAVLGGEAAPSIDYLCRIANVLDVDPHELMRPPRKPRSDKG